MTPDEPTTAHRSADLMRALMRGGRRAAGGLWNRASRIGRSPVHKARAAHARGDSVFQHAEPVDPGRGHGQLLSDIEAVGWRLDQTHHVTETDEHTDADGRLHTHTTTFAIYDFRRVDEQ